MIDVALKLAVRGSLALWLAAVAMSGAAWASSVYGEGPYSGCAVQTECTATPAPSASASPSPVPTVAPTEPTVGETPSGLQFAVNLSDGQVLPRSGYTVIVTPLNGGGQSFEWAEIWLDGRRVATVAPDADGTARWRWDTGRLPARQVRVVVYEAGGESKALEFRVSIAEAEAVAPGLLGLLPPAAATQITRLVRQIPLPVARAFPYLLFMLLGGVILGLVIQARREVAQNLALEAIVARERLVAEEKVTFLQLVSHYLRTPLTLLMAAADSLSFKPELPADRTRQVVDGVGEVRATVTGLLKRLDESRLLADVPAADTVPRPYRTWARPGFWLPVSLLAVVTVVFNYLVAVAGEVDVGVVNLVTQLLVGVLLAVVLYLVLRGRRLRQVRRERTEQVAEHQRQVDQARAEFIEAVGVELTARLEAFAGLLPLIEGSSVAGALRDGYGRYQRLASSCAVAAKLRVGQSQAPLEATTLGMLLRPGRDSVTAVADAKRITIAADSNTALALRHPAWISQVLGSVLENAVAYTRGSGSIEVDALAGPPGVITVRDHGVGVPPDKLEQLFKPFFKAEGALTFDHEGEGLSLYLDRLIMHYLGGEIAMQSEVGRGSVVTLTFPGV